MAGVRRPDRAACPARGAAMIADQAIRNDWHVVYRSREILPRARSGRSVCWVRTWCCGARAVWRWPGSTSAFNRGSRLSMGRVLKGEMVCPYHGWRYDREGRCTLIPSQPDEPIPRRARAITYHCRESYGFVWVCMGEPSADLPPHPEWDDADYDKVYTGPYEFDSGGPRVVENVLDVTHFPFVHDAMLGRKASPKRSVNTRFGNRRRDCAPARFRCSNRLGITAGCRCGAPTRSGARAR